MALEIETQAPRPAPRQWATAITSYVQAEGPQFSGFPKRWLNGVTFKPYGCDHITGAPLGAGGGVDGSEVSVLTDTRVTSYLTKDDAVRFYPFVAEVAVQGPLMGDSNEELIAFLLAHSEVERSSILGAQVERGLFQTANASLASAATDVSGGDNSLLGAMYYIEQGLAGRLDGGAGMIHMTPGLFTLFAAGGGVRYDADGRPMTQTGHFIIADAGYIGASPYTLDTVADQLWIYGSGPVVAFMDPDVSVAADLDSFDRTRNDWSTDVEQAGIAYFDPCAVVAAVVGLGDDNVAGGPVGS